MKKLFLTVFAVVSLGTVANAQAQTFTFEGDAVFGNLSQAQLFGVNDLTSTFSGQVDFDLGAPGQVQVATPTAGFTSYAYTSLVLTLGTETFIYTGNQSQGNIVGLGFLGVGGPDLLNFNAGDDISFFVGTITNIGLNFNLPPNSISGQTLDQVSAFADVPLFATSGAINFTNGNIPSGRVELENLTLSQVSTVPEPATWLMMIIGFAGVGLASRHRRQMGLA